MNGNRLNSPRTSEQAVIPISIDEDSDRSPEELQALVEEYMLPPHQPGIAS